MSTKGAIKDGPCSRGTQRGLSLWPELRQWDRAMLLSVLVSGQAGAGVSESPWLRHTEDGSVLPAGAAAPGACAEPWRAAASPSGPWKAKQGWGPSTAQAGLASVQPAGRPYRAALLPGALRRPCEPAQEGLVRPPHLLPEGSCAVTCRGACAPLLSPGTDSRRKRGPSHTFISSSISDIFRSKARLSC